VWDVKPLLTFKTADFVFVLNDLNNFIYLSICFECLHNKNTHINDATVAQNKTKLAAIAHSPSSLRQFLSIPLCQYHVPSSVPRVSVAIYYTL